ncbi:hypothetical protein [Haloarcula halobia]|uniref:hypothetical protein n=1 Tax=Haloarcula halobia TaxID=3033388 RepID=UPI0023EB53F7|nr:hypothetical protein [Halomicroarcula sp. XH51]
MAETLDFVTMGDTNYFETMSISSEKISEFYPEATFYVYDWGLKPDEYEKMEQMSNTVVIDNFQIEPDFNSLEQIQYTLGANLERYGDLMKDNDSTIDIIINRLKKEIGYKKFKKRFDLLMQNKLECLKDVAKRTDSGVVFLDADAVLVNEIDILKRV